MLHGPSIAQMAKAAQALIGEAAGINSVHGRARATMPVSRRSIWWPPDRNLESSMIARSICATLTAAFLAALVIACGSHETRAAGTETAIFAGGCFWCMEAAFDEVDGVTETISGYAGGTKPNPNYGDHEGYMEAVKVTFDPAKVTYAKLLDHYLAQHRSVRSERTVLRPGQRLSTVVFVANDAEKQLAEKTKEEIAARFKQKVATADQAGDHVHRGGGLPPELSQHQSGELQVLQMGLRPRPAARPNLGQAELSAIHIAARSVAIGRAMDQTCKRQGRGHLSPFRRGAGHALDQRAGAARTVDERPANLQRPSRALSRLEVRFRRAGVRHAADDA